MPRTPSQRHSLTLLLQAHVIASSRSTQAPETVWCTVWVRLVGQRPPLPPCRHRPGACSACAGVGMTDLGPPGARERAGCRPRAATGSLSTHRPSSCACVGTPPRTGRAPKQRVEKDQPQARRQTMETVSGGGCRLDSDERRHTTRHFTRRVPPLLIRPLCGLPEVRNREWSPFQLVRAPLNVPNIRTTPAATVSPSSLL